MARFSPLTSQFRLRPRLHTLPLCFVVAEYADATPVVMQRIAGFVRRRVPSAVSILLHPDYVRDDSPFATDLLDACLSFRAAHSMEVRLQLLDTFLLMAPRRGEIADLSRLLDLPNVSRPQLLRIARNFAQPLLDSFRRPGEIQAVATACDSALDGFPPGGIGIVVLPLESFAAAHIARMFGPGCWRSAVLPLGLLTAVDEPEKLAQALTCSLTRLRIMEAVERGLTDDDCVVIALDLLLQTAIRYLAWQTKETADAPKWVPCPQIPAYFSAGLLQEMQRAEVQRLCDVVLAATVSKRPNETHALKRAGLRVMLRYMRRCFGGGKGDSRQVFEAIARHVLREAKPKEPFMAGMNC